VEARRGYGLGGFRRRPVKKQERAALLRQTNEEVVLKLGLATEKIVGIKISKK